MRSSRITFFLASSLLLFFSTYMADGTSNPGAASPAKKEESAVYIVFVDWPEGVEPEAFHIRTLAAVLGSEAAAKKALIHQYRTVASGFSATLTEKQKEALRKQPGVVNIIPSRIYYLQGGLGSLVQSERLAN